MAHTIQAIRAHTHGSPDVLQLDRIDRPEPAPNEVLIRVHAAGVLPMDCAVRGGLLAGIVPRSLPYIPGTAIAGVIEAVGAEVTDFYVGQAVCGRSPNGAYTEYTVVNAKPPVLNPDTVGYRQTVHIAPLAAKPERLTFDEAATLSGGAVTAWTSLFEDGGVQAGQRVLIHAAAGGVGLFAAQFARWKGAHVIGTASTVNLDYLRSIGVETVIDYTTTRFEDVVQDVDFVLDSIGGDTLTRSMNIVKRGGTLVSIVTEPPADLAQELGIRAIKNATLPTSAHLRQIVEVIDAGHATPLIQQVFPLHEARLAHELCETGHGRGRIVLHIAD